MNPFKKLSVALINAGLIFSIVAVFTGVIGYSYYTMLRLVDNDSWSRHTYEVLLNTDAVITDLLDAETGMRGYIITGDQTFLQPYTTALQDVYTHFQTLQTLTADNATEQARLAKLRPLIDQKLAELDLNIQLRTYKSAAEATAGVASGRGKAYMDAIRVIVADIDTTESSLLVQRVDSTTQTATATRNVLLYGGILGFILYLIVNAIISRFVIKDLVSKPFLEKEKQANFYARSLLEASLDPLVTISPGGKITDLNEAALKITGLTREKLLGSDFVNYFTNPQEALEGYERAFKLGFVSDYPLTIKSTEGKLTDVLLNASVYKNEQGVILGVFAAARDYTRIKQATEAVELINREMEAFSSSVSHDLRAPLRVIDGYAQMLGEDYGAKLDDEGKRLISNIRGSATQMRQIIEDLLAFSRLGSQEIKKEVVSMGTMAQDVFDELKHVAPDRDIVCHVQQIPDARADKDTIRLVWTNLLSNAIKYTKPRAHATIEISSTSDADSITYYVKDNGVGFDMKYVNKLFNVFQRLHRMEDFEGTGVGLANVKRIVERHGGKVHAEGKVDDGATFSFTLPKL